MFYPYYSNLVTMHLPLFLIGKRRPLVTVLPSYPPITSEYCKHPCTNFSAEPYRF
jgi:hypothetical protein